MSRIEISIFDQNAVFTNLPDIFSGDVNVDTVKFVFDNSWNDFSTKTAVFYNEPKNTYMQILDENGIATIPYEVMLNKTRISIGVFGTNTNGDVKTSQILTFGVGRGAIAEDMTTNPATPDVWLQILTSYDEIKTDFEDLSSSVDSRINTMGNQLNTMENTLDEISESIDTVLAEAELIGDISELETTDKSSVVNAINEINAVSVKSVLFESEIIFEGSTGDFTKSLDNFDGISFLTYPTNNATTYAKANAMFPTKNILDRLSVIDEVMLTLFGNGDFNMKINNTSITTNSTDIRVYGHNIKGVLNNG